MVGLFGSIGVVVGALLGWSSPGSAGALYTAFHGTIVGSALGVAIAMFGAWRRAREPIAMLCPEDGQQKRVSLNAARAALSVLPGCEHKITGCNGQPISCTLGCRDDLPTNKAWQLPKTTSAVPDSSE